jgi:hypothetical protein
MDEENDERTIFSLQNEEARQYYPKRFNLIKAITYFHYFRNLCDGEYFGTPRFSVRRFYDENSPTTAETVV